MKKTKASQPQSPKCVFCGRTGSGVTFTIFIPRFKPFGTACTECEATLPAGTVLPATQSSAPLVTLVYHVTGAIERGETTAIVEQTA